MPATAVMHVDESRWPLVQITQRGVMDDAEYQRFLQTLAGHLQRASSFAYVYEFAFAQRPLAGRIAQQAEFVRAHRDALAQHCVGLAFAFSSPVFRFAISSFLLLQPLPVPYEVARDVRHATVWAEHKLRAAGLTVPAAR